MDTAKVFPLEHNGEVVMCRTVDDRKLLQEAFLLETEPAICDTFTAAQLRAIAAACSTYEFSALASEIEEIARKCDEIERP